MCTYPNGPKIERRVALNVSPDTRMDMLMIAIQLTEGIKAHEQRWWRFSSEQGLAQLSRPECTLAEYSIASGDTLMLKTEPTLNGNAVNGSAVNGS